MDISRIINCKNMSKVFSDLVDKYYYKYETNINHLFYTLRVNVNWYNHIIEKKQENIYNLEQAKSDIINIVEKGAGCSDCLYSKFLIQRFYTKLIKNRQISIKIRRFL